MLRSRPRLRIIYATLVLGPTGRLDAAEAWLRDAELVLRTAREDSVGTGRTMLARDEEIDRLVKLGGVAAVNLSDGLLDVGDLPAANQRSHAAVAADRPRAHGGRTRVLPPP